MTKKAVKAKENLKQFKVKVEAEIEKIYKEELKVAKEFSTYAVDYITELKNITLIGGKRLRGALAYYTYLMYGGSNFDAILKIAAAIEIIHAFLLIEDDFMDLAKTRRGYTTIHETYRIFHKKNHFKRDSKHFGDSIAVNVGIIADHIALNAINNTNFPLELKYKALRRLNRQIITTGHGQIHDILNEVRTNLSEEDVLNVLYWKTGIYTYDNPIHIGAILAGANGEELPHLSQYAIPGGVAFQIQDDILGSFGDEDKTGKPADGDIREGKQTLLTLKAYENCSSADRKILNEVLGDQNASLENIVKVRKIFSKTGALDYSKNKALELVKQAKTALFKFKRDDWVLEGIDFLEGIADYMIDREL